MRVTVLINDSEYRKFSDIKLCYTKYDGTEKQVSLLFSDYERVFDYITDHTSIKFDFFLISAIIYGVDNLLSRNIYSNDGWTRDIEVELPVNNLHNWQGNEDRLVEILNFLTGDNWTVTFVQNTQENYYSPRPLSRRSKNLPINYNKNLIKSVSLFSGGLDSLIGIINELQILEAGKKILLVSHFDNKSKGPNSDQLKLLTHLNREYHDKIYWVQSKLALSRKDNDGIKFNVEKNYRSRSLFFIGLGCYLSPINKLIIPENGTISINYPLTPSRVSSLSTRTTHPFILKKIQELLDVMGIDMIISNPYTLKTKGEMILECSNQIFLREIYMDSVSCGKRGRRQHHLDNPDENHHCGRCMPCIYRRAALNKANLDDEKQYGNFITKVLSLGNNDLPALFNYLKKDISVEKMERDLIVNGNIDNLTLNNYAQMVLRSKDEVLSLFRDKGNTFVKTKLNLR
ncbi:Qat anti-phage system QueC-like protein QatC [Chryseobacterium scophthalmum]|uniref:Qat anti-phage system QueC-like protein QatC n=1 Tax=Chryseobacterium scophthalmum TaxID=59733 RepID=UPI00398BB542